MPEYNQLKFINRLPDGLITVIVVDNQLCLAETDKLIIQDNGEQIDQDRWPSGAVDDSRDLCMVSSFDFVWVIAITTAHAEEIIAEIKKASSLLMQVKPPGFGLPVDE